MNEKQEEILIGSAKTAEVHLGEIARRLSEMVAAQRQTQELLRKLLDKMPR